MPPTPHPLRLVATLLALAVVVTVLVGTGLTTSPAGRTAGDRAGADPLPRADLASATTAAATAAGVRGAPGVGFSPGFSIMYQPLAELRRDLRGMYRVGARRLRIDVSWALVEWERGRFDWSRPDRVIREARAAGLSVLAVIGYVPPWAQTPTGAVRPALFARFVDQASRRYARSVGAWEIWNEPNLERFWDPRPNPAAYARLIAAAAPRIRSNAPRALILVGALAPAVDADTELSPETFLRRFYRAIPRHSVFDGISVHPYSYPAMPLGDEQWNTFHRLPEIRAVAVRAGDRDVRVWLTEYGAPTGASDRSVTPRRQAAMLVQAVREARRLRLLGPLYLYSYRDAGAAAHDPESNFGVVDHSGRAKAAWSLLQRELLR